MSKEITLNLNTLQDDTDHVSAGSVRSVKSARSVKSVSSRKSSTGGRVNIREEASNDISLDELAEIANKHKIKETGSFNIRDSSSHIDLNDEGGEQMERGISKRYSKTVRRENKDPEVRRKKMDLLYSISQLSKNKIPTVSMEDSFDDIEAEFTRINNEHKSDKGIEFCKGIFKVSVQGIEMANNRFDPIGVDLDGWGSAIEYALINKEYDDVFGELYEKYKGTGTIGPELRLMFMVGGSAAMFAYTKRVAERTDKMFDSNKEFNVRQQQREYTEPDSFVSSSKMDEPGDSIDLQNILSQMKDSKFKKKGRPPGSKNKKASVILE